MKITRNWKCHPQLKQRSFFTSNFWCAKKNQFGCAIFRILIYLNPKILHISFLKPFLAIVIKLFSSYKKLCRAVFKRRSCNSKTFWFVFFCIYLKQLPLIPKSIFTGEYQQHQYTSFFILIFHIQLNMLYMRKQNLHKQPV